MAFSYDATQLSDARNEIRFRLGDTVDCEGPRPWGNDRSNFSDAEIDKLYSDEENTVLRAVAAGLEQLSREWISFSISKSAGDTSLDAKDVAKTYAKLAEEERAKSGAGDSSRTLQAGVISLDFMQKDSMS